MVEIPCLPSQTFWCLAVPNDPLTRNHNPTIEEIILAQQPEHAKRQIERLWCATCEVIRSQSEVEELLKQLKTFVIKSDDLLVPESFFFSRLIGRKEHQIEEQEERYYVSGISATGVKMFSVVMAQTILMACNKVLELNPGFSPKEVYSQTQLSNLLATMESARTGKINVTRALASDSREERTQEILSAFHI